MLALGVLTRLTTHSGQGEGFRGVQVMCNAWLRLLAFQSVADAAGVVGWRHCSQYLSVYSGI